MNKYIETSLDGSVAIVKMNRPPANAISLDFLYEFRGVSSEVSEDQSARVVVITSSIPGGFAARHQTREGLRPVTMVVPSKLSDFSALNRK